MKRRWLIAAMVVLLSPAAANAQDSTRKEPSLLRRVLLVQGDGWGGSAVTNVGSFFFNGDYNVFSAGIGFGLSYKARAGAVHKYPLEIGFYAERRVVVAEKLPKIIRRCSKRARSIEIDHAMPRRRRTG